MTAIDGFLEPFTGWLLRLGPDAHVMNDPWEWAVAVANDGDRARVIGLSKRYIRGDEYEFIVRKINEGTGLLIKYERKGDRPALVLQADPAKTNGEIVMNKTHHVNEAKKSDGKIDQAIALQHTLEACALMAGGKLDIIEMSQTDLGNGRTSRTFVVQEKA